MKLLGPLIFTLIAALGNAMFAGGRKSAVTFDNEFVFVALAAGVCIVLTLLVAPVFGPTQYGAMVRTNGLWIMLSGCGLFLTYLGFNLLYSQYGASYYILYAVLSIVTTAIVVGVVMFQELFNTYHWLAFLTSMMTVVLFTLGNRGR